MSDLGHAAATVKRRPSSSTVLIGLPLIGVVLGAVLALAVGAGTPKKTSSPVAATPAVAVVAAGDLRVTLPDGWTQEPQRPARPGLPRRQDCLHTQLGRRCRRRAAAGGAPVVAAAGLDAMKCPTSSPPTAVRAGALQGYHYVRAAKGQRVLELVVVPTTHGIATIACSSAVAAPGECDQALRGLARRTASSSR